MVAWRLLVPALTAPSFLAGHWFAGRNVSSPGASHVWPEVQLGAVQGKLPSNDGVRLGEEEEAREQQVEAVVQPGAGAPRQPAVPVEPPALPPVVQAAAATCGSDAEPGTKPPSPPSGSCQSWVSVMQDALAFSLDRLAAEAPPGLVETARAVAASLSSKVAGADEDAFEGALQRLGPLLAAKAPSLRGQAQKLVESFLQAYPAHRATLDGQDLLLLLLGFLMFVLLVVWEFIGVVRLLIGGLRLAWRAVHRIFCWPLRRRLPSRGRTGGASAPEDRVGSGLGVVCRRAKDEEVGGAVEIFINSASRLVDALNLEGAADQAQFSLPAEWSRSLGVQDSGPLRQQQHPTVWRAARKTPTGQQDNATDGSFEGALTRTLVRRSIRLLVEADTRQQLLQSSKTKEDLAACSTASGTSLATQRSLHPGLEEVHQEPAQLKSPVRERIRATSPSEGLSPVRGLEACGNGTVDAGGLHGVLSWQRHVIAEAASPQRSPNRTLQVVPENEAMREEDDADRGAGSPMPTISIVPPGTPEAPDAREPAQQKSGLLRPDDVQAAACLYSVGEAVELLDGDGVSWVEAQVLATFPTEGTDRVNGTVYSIPRGAVKISCASGQKFVLAQDVEAVLRKPTEEDRAVPRLPDYLRVSERLGAGAYGEVFLCEDSRDDSQVAVKWVRDFARDPLFGKRILREIRILAALEHENLLKLKDLLPVPGPDFDDVYIVMPCLQYDLHKAIYSKMQLTEKHAQAFICQILRGLKYLHSAGVVHRDLKPSNILVNKDCTLRIADLGLARGRVYDEETLTDYVVTRWYRAPELMLLPSGYFEAIDIWSVGCIHVEILTRRPLFRCENHVTMLRAIADTLGFKKERDLSWLPEECKQRDTVLAFIDSIGLADEPSKPLKEYLRAAPSCTEFVHHLLRFDPNRRCSATEALGHSYLSHLRDPMGELTAVKPFAWDFDRFEPTAQALKDRVYAECARRHPEILSRDAELLAEHNRITPLLEEAAGSDGPRGPPPSRAPARSSSTGGPAAAAAAAAALASPA